MRRLGLLLMLLVWCNSFYAQERTQDFNFNWKFTLVEDTKTPTNLPLDDTKWRDVRLPHDWSVEASFSEDLDGATGYLPGGVGIYQKHFDAPTDAESKNVFVLFDGVYNNATFWLNGKLLGENPYGYSPTYFDLTEVLKTDGTKNILTVHVDHSRYVDSRWYTGSGIYRHVKLITVDKLHIPIWGTFVTTPEVSTEVATVQIQTKIKNGYSKNQNVTLITKIIDNEGKTVTLQEKETKIGSGKEIEVLQSLQVANPKLWDTENPNLYKVITNVSVKGKVIDTYTTPFGIRSLLFDKDKGFFLNGKPTYVKGVCLHHDAGLVGAAVPKGVWERRLQILKEGGVNAIRTSHNPFSEEFLDLCDEMGFLVQNEIFDEMDNPKDKQHNMNEKSVQYITRGYTEHFQKWGESDLKRTMLRDRNHPSVFQWSIGNEIEWTYEGYKHVSGLWDPEVKGGYWNKIPHLTKEEMIARYNALPDRKFKLAETAKRLSKWVKEMDQTRPVTANLTSLASGYADALDVVGFSYQTNQYHWSKKNYPNKLFTGTENSGGWQDWNSIIENPMVFSMFMWTGIDYMGEATNKWPQKGWDGDLLDFAGFKKQGWYYFKSIWVNKPHVSIGTTPLEGSGFESDSLSGKAVASSKKVLNWNNSKANMHWNYKPGELVVVEVPTNNHVVELFLNNRSLGSRSLSDNPDRILRWVVPFEAGTLTARAGFEGQEVESVLKTTSAAVAIKLSVDKTTLNSDGYDVAHIIAQLVDKDGLEVKTENAELTFNVDGNVKVLGVDNGSKDNIQDFQSNKIITSKGKALLLVQALKHKTGKINIKAKAANLKSNLVVIQVE
ncbi:glycoside hydrolase family 2 TIM barrel-domain containing protein [Algibacter lectus]|uniref:glycoside hydrolase family 2 TIM barrel-domain containing protein n=1 Tax=Algibacter lectus TaxID=221126 RepID=UPI0026EA5E89|nr:glycoside hydrolase family 2 TIM barrel-domain containing protein [Algibacter lectus]MDO7135856.1 glycoside hydrolase family 2 TIM barrel-domain containing protein [Algibacter lectus]